MREKYSCYEFEIKPIKEGWVYDIYADGCYPYSDEEIIESQEFYDTEQEARLAAMGHINLLENGERLND